MNTQDQKQRYILHIAELCGCEVEQMTVREHPDQGWTEVIDNDGMWSFSSYIGFLDDGRPVIFNQEDSIEPMNHLPSTVDSRFVFASVDDFIIKTH